MLPIGVYADDSGPWHVIVDNWQTHKPRVTALRSLNAYLATDKGQAVYYVPTLEELPNIKNAVADTHIQEAAQGIVDGIDAYFK